MYSRMVCFLLFACLSSRLMSSRPPTPQTVWENLLLRQRCGAFVEALAAGVLSSYTFYIFDQIACKYNIYQWHAQDFLYVDRHGECVPAASSMWVIAYGKLMGCGDLMRIDRTAPHCIAERQGPEATFAGHARRRTRLISNCSLRARTNNAMQPSWGASSQEGSERKGTASSRSSPLVPPPFRRR